MDRDALGNRPLVRAVHTCAARRKFMVCIVGFADYADDELLACSAEQKSMGCEIKDRRLKRVKKFFVILLKVRRYDVRCCLPQRPRVVHLLPHLVMCGAADERQRLCYRRPRVPCGKVSSRKIGRLVNLKW